MFWFVGNVVAFVVGLQWGIVGVATAYLIATILIEPVRAYLTTRALGIPIWRFVGAFSTVAQATTLMAVAVLGARALFIEAGLPSALQLVLLTAIGVVVTQPPASGARQTSRARSRVPSAGVGATQTQCRDARGAALADRLGAGAETLAHRALAAEPGAPTMMTCSKSCRPVTLIHEPQRALKLTPRELEVLQMISWELTNAEAARVCT